MATRKHYIGFSGGKDSTATWLVARERGIEAEPVFCDTGHEHPLTYEYLDYLETQLGPIRRIKADFSAKMETRRNNLQKFWEKDGLPQERIDRVKELLQPTGNPFLDLCMMRGRFPSTRARFCTQELKVFPFQEQVLMPDLRAGLEVEQWVGVRRQESAARAAIEKDREWTDPGYWIYRPILDWTHDEVFAIHAKHDIDPNPLYLKGMGRVGCMPCIMASKGELQSIAKRFPEEFERLNEWERLVAETSKHGLATFFAQDKTPGEAEDMTRSNALAVRDWALTSRGGRQFDLLLVHEEPRMCDSMYGLCE